MIIQGIDSKRGLFNQVHRTESGRKVVSNWLEFGKISAKTSFLAQILESNSWINFMDQLHGSN
jgi:hypothetical protein